MSTLVLRCGDAPVPIALASMTTICVGARPTDGDVDDEAIPILDADTGPRLIVLGDDAALAAVLTHLMRIERLNIEIAYVAVENSPAARCYHIGTGSEAAKRAIDGRAEQTPLIRDDSGVVLVGRAVITGADGISLDGEAYVDDTRIFDGKATALTVEATATLPGLAAWVDRKRFRKKGPRTEGRAVQLGTPGAVVTRDGIPSERVVKRSSFYRHHEPWLLVR